MFQLIVLAITAVLVGLDQLTKWLAVTLFRGEEPLTVIPGFFELTYVENRGAAFGMMQGGRWLFIVLTGAVMVALLALLLFGRYRSYMMFNAGVILTVAGGIGNFVDRLFQGYVVDFLHVFLRTEAISWDFPVFNFADCCVVIGSVVLLLFFFFFYDEKGQKKPAEDTHETDANS
jgi:signal peptidase II